MKKKLNYWIRERHNPQLGVYYVAHGQLTNREAKAHEKCLYGWDLMLEFNTEDEYLAELQKLKDRGEKVQ